MHFFRLSIDNLEAELQSLSFKARSVKDSIRRDPKLFYQMESFLQVCRIYVNVLLSPECSSIPQLSVICVDKLIK